MATARQETVMAECRDVLERHFVWHLPVCEIAREAGVTARAARRQIASAWQAEVNDLLMRTWLAGGS